MALADAPATGGVVEPEGGGVGPGHTFTDHALAPEERDEEGQGRHQVRGVVEKPLPFVQCLVDQAEVTVLEIAETAVDHL